MKHILLFVMLSVTLSFSGCGSDASHQNSAEQSENALLMENYTIHGFEHDAPSGLTTITHSQEATLPNVGDVLIYSGSDHFPNGKLHRVIDVLAGSNSTKLVVDQAALTDAFKSMDMVHEAYLEPAPIATNEALLLSDGPTIKVRHALKGVKLIPHFQGPLLRKGDHTFSKKYHFTLKIDNVDLGHGVSLVGELRFSIKVHLALIIKHRRLEYVNFYIEPSQEGDVTLSATESHSLEKSRVLARYTFPSIDIPVGFIPLVIVPVLEFKTGVNGEVTAGMSTGFHQTLSTKVGLKYSKHRNGLRHKHPKWFPVHRTESSFDFIKPHFNADASLKFYVGPELDLLIYDVAGPSAEFDAYLQATVDLLGNPWWKLFWGLGATAGFDLRILNHEISHVSFDVFDYHHELADAGKPFPSKLTR